MEKAMSPPHVEGPLADLGVLFVHGIGEPPQGQTLSQCTEPLVDWMQAFGGVGAPAGIVAAEVGGAALRPPLLADDTPAHAELRVTQDDDGQALQQRWLCAEAWWGAQVRPPSIVDFTRWSLSRGAWLLLLHLDRWWLGPRRGIRRWILALPTIVVWLVASLGLNAVLVLAALLALVPLGSVHRAVLGLLRALTGVVGDAYVLIRHPVQRSALEETTVHALAWLKRRAKQVVVVAHSQGAAVALGALRRPDAPAVSGFVSVGSGIVKLHALRWFEHQLPANRAAAALAAPMLVLGLGFGLRARQLQLADEAALWFGPGLLVAAGVMAVVVAWKQVHAGLDALQDSQGRLRPLATTPDFRWHDVVSTHDPVPLGNLGQYVARLPAFDQHRLVVLRSFLQDHTHYWQAKASFVPLLVSLLARFAGAPAAAFEAVQARMDHATARRDVDLRMLRWVGVLDFLALAIPLALAAPRLADTIAAWRVALRGDAQTASPLQTVDASLAQLEGAVRWLVVLAQGDGPAAGVPGFVNGLLATVLMVLALVLWRRLAFALWELWADARTEEVLSGRADRPLHPVSAQLLAELPEEFQANWVGRLATRILGSALDSSGGTLRERFFAASLRSLFEGVVTVALVLPFALSITWTLGPPDWFRESLLYGAWGTVAAVLLVIAMFLQRLGDLLGLLQPPVAVLAQAWLDRADLPPQQRSRVALLVAAQHVLHRMLPGRR